MKKYFILLGFILFTILLQASNHSYLLNGEWYNPRLEERIFIKDNKDYIVIKGLFDSQRPIYFDRVGKNSFEDCYGNRIRVENFATIKINMIRGKSIRFEKLNCHYYDFHECEYHEYRNRNNGAVRSEYYRDRYFNKNTPQYSNDINNENLEGTWINDVDKKYLAIITTRDGFKVKYSGTYEWTDFYSDNGQYKDAKGNTYIFSDERNGIWIGSKNNRRIKIKKISEEVEY